MITIKFGRYVPTLKVKTTLKGHNYNLFESKIDHEITRLDELLDLSRALKISHKWLKDHFGFVLIYLNNTSEEDSEHIIKICNYKKFLKEMLKNNIEIKLINHIDR